MDPNLRQKIEQYNGFNWEFLTRKESFAEGKNFIPQKRLFDQIKKSFDFVFDNIEVLVELLPSHEINQIGIQVDKLSQLRNRISGYSDTNRHNEMVDDIKRTCFEIQESLAKYIEYINPSEISEKLKKELEELIKAKNEVEIIIREKLEALEQGIQKTSEGKRRISGVEAAKFYEEQAARHRNNAEGSGGFLFWNVLSSRGWLESRNIMFYFIVGTILLIIVLYVLTFFMIDSGRLKEIWNVHSGVLFVALLSVMYAGLYFSTKNYDREKELEYRNKVRANIANTWLLFSAGQNDKILEVVTKEASKTLFSDIEIENNKSQENRNISISIPQTIGKNLNGDQ